MRNSDKANSLIILLLAPIAKLLSSIFHFPYQTVANFQHDLTFEFSNSQIQIIKLEINYLQKIYNESISIGDFTRQLAAEQIISNKLNIFEALRQKHKSSANNQIEKSESMENELKQKSIQSSTLSDKFLNGDQVGEQMRRLLKNYVNNVRKQERLMNIDKPQNQFAETSLISLKQDQQEYFHKQMTNPKDELHQLSNLIKIESKKKKRKL